MFIRIERLIRKPLLLLLVASLIASCDGPQNPLTEEVTTRSVQDEMLNQVNKLRTEGCNCGGTYFPPVPILKWDFLLEKAAKRHSKDMSENDHFDHVGTDGSTFTERIREAGYKEAFASENIAFGYISVASVINGLKKSPGHCRNIMSPSITEMGVAMSNNYWTQVLAKPKAP